MGTFIEVIGILGRGRPEIFGPEKIAQVSTDITDSVIHQTLSFSPGEAAATTAYSQLHGRKNQFGPLLTGALARESQACKACNRCSDRKRVVWGEGPLHADVMVISDFPSALDDETGVPLSGPYDVWDEKIKEELKDSDKAWSKTLTSGAPDQRFFRDSWLPYLRKKLGSPEAVERFAKPPVLYITHSLKCRGGGVLGTDAQQESCLPWLLSERKACGAPVVFMLGEETVRRLLRKPLMDVKGSWVDSETWGPVLPWWSPSDIEALPPQQREGAYVKLRTLLDEAYSRAISARSAPVAQPLLDPEEEGYEEESEE